MRALVVIGVLLILFGIAALAVQGVTFFTSERVVDAVLRDRFQNYPAPPSPAA